MWLQVMKRPLILLRLLGIFIQYWRVFSTVSSPKLHRLCVWLMYTFWNVNMPNVTAGYGRFSDSIAFFGYFSVTLCSHYFCNFRKKVLDPNGPYISTFQTILRNFCLSVISEFWLSSVVCSASPAYTGLCRGLKYLLKVRYIILNDPNVARFLIFETLCWGRAKTLTYVWTFFHKNEHITHSFIELS